MTLSPANSRRPSFLSSPPEKKRQKTINIPLSPQVAFLIPETLQVFTLFFLFSFATRRTFSFSFLHPIFFSETNSLENSHLHQSSMPPHLTQQEIVPAPGDVGALANRINKATHAIHNQINNLISIKIVFALRDPRIYRQGIQSFYHVFRTFEECWAEAMEGDDHIAHILKEVWTPAMVRTGPLEKDLLFYYDGAREKFETPIMGKQIEFVEHIRKSIKEKPHLALAYGHTMYLALFAGGRILRSSIMKSAGLFPQVEGLTTEEVALRGTNLFRFEEIEDEDQLRMDFKSRYELATRSALTEQEKREIIDESMEIFQRNIECVKEIALKNSTIMTQKIGYKIYQTGKIVVIALLLFLVFFQLRRMLFV